VVDRPELCDFTTPAIVDRNPVLVAVGTGGASAGLAKQLRLRIEALLPENLGALARGLYGARAALRARFADAGVRRRALDAALGAGGALDPFDPNSAAQLGSWLEGAQEGLRSGVIEIRLSSDDPEDLTLRQARLLGSADGIAVGEGVSGAVLARARADAMRCAMDEFALEQPRDGLWILLYRDFV
jgi:uroporphyrin-III C-methyltransferase/precorrin-2 dehydrogenase/sirohydrochlorin ferrochelatase